jgi:very-short-patch-repair endonuclease
LSGELRKLARKAEQEAPENALVFQLRAAKIGGWKREVEWHPARDYHFDFYWPKLRLAVEVEGGQSVPGGGHHQRRGGYEHDCTKYNEAALMGFTLLRFTSRQVFNGTALRYVERAIWLLRKEAR